MNLLADVRYENVGNVVTCDVYTHTQEKLAKQINHYLLKQHHKFVPRL